MEQPPTMVRIANHPFVRFEYGSPAAELHWHVLATQIRCHMVQFVFTSRDTKLIESLIQEMDKMNLPDEAGPISGRGGRDFPVCVQDYARREKEIGKGDTAFAVGRLTTVLV